MLDEVTARKKKASDNENEARKKELSESKAKIEDESRKSVNDGELDVFSDDILNK